MKYCMLLWPHSNVRYQNETLKLAENELRLMLDALAPDARILPYTALSMPALQIEMEGAMPRLLLEAIACHSLLYGLFEIGENAALTPICGRAEAYVGGDLAGILKYKGKTNELFLQLMTNVALYSSTFSKYASDRLELLDPMCGRGTTLFVAANRGWNATGSDVDKNDLSEAEKFLKRYFEYHRKKYALKKSSRTVAGGKPAAVSQFSFSDTPEAYKEGDLSVLSLCNGDATRTRDIFGKEKFHMIVCDLPYGVQHGAVGGSLEQLLAKAASGWLQSLKKGGSAVISYNAQTMKTAKAREILEKAGFEVLQGGAYDGFSHWVEQAVTRDIAVGRKK